MGHILNCSSQYNFCVCTVLGNVQVNLFKTGGGPPAVAAFSELDVRVVETFHHQFYPLSNSYDDDAVMDLQTSLVIILL